MPSHSLDLRDMPPAARHPKIFESFDALEGGEALEIINDHDPQPLFYQLQAERDAFDAEGYSVEERGENEFVAVLPKSGP